MAGEILKKRREELGQNLKDIAHTLRIRYDYLKAIENNEFEKLPVEVYTKGYIREYARHLKIDPEPVIKAYLQKISPPPPEKTIPPVEVIKKKKIDIRYVLAGIILLIIASVYFLFYSGEEPEIPRPETTAPPPFVQPVQPAEGIEKKEEPLKEHNLEIVASETTWILIKTDESEQKEMLLQPKDSIKLSAKSRFSLKIGNAGGIKLTFDGKDLGIPGKKGQVVSMNLPPENAQSPETPSN